MTSSDADTRRIRELVEALTKMKLKEILDSELTDGAKRKIYELTGSADTRKLVRLTGMSAGAISGLWQKWHAMGIITKRGKFYCKLFEEKANVG
jgi:hypothetical protein